MSIFDYRTVAPGATEMEEVYRLRYKVYCLECGYEDADDYHDGLESDDFDDVSTHFIASEKYSGKVVGTARIIHAEEKGLPALNNFKLQKKLLPDIPLSQVGEISRLAISKEYRRQAVDKAIQGDKIISLQSRNVDMRLRRKFETDLVCGLYYSIYQESIDCGITHLFAVMADSLYAILQRWGLEFKPVGPVVDYHGLRRPYIAAIEENIHCFERVSSAAFA